MLCGGAQAALADAGIKLYGCVSGIADEAVAAFLAGKLDYNQNVKFSDAGYQIVQEMEAPGMIY